MGPFLPTRISDAKAILISGKDVPNNTADAAARNGEAVSGLCHDAAVPSSNFEKARFAHSRSRYLLEYLMNYDYNWDSFRHRDRLDHALGTDCTVDHVRDGLSRIGMTHKKW